MTIKEMKMEKIKIRNTEPEKSAIIEKLLDVATKIAKSELREANGDDVITAVKRCIKEDEKVIELIDSKKGDSTKWKSELELLKLYLPDGKDDTEIIKDAIVEIRRSLDLALRKENRGAWMRELKKYNVDMGQANKILGSLLI